MATTHSAQQSTYTLPNDTPEANRLDMQHELFRLTFKGNLIFAPISPQPTAILDIGCGTSSWPIEVANLYPDTKVYGMDLGIPQPDTVPSSYTYLVGSFEKPWPFPDGHFDYVHGRFINIAMVEHDFVVSEALRCLKPGGWFEMQEFSLPGRTSVESVRKFWNDYVEVAAKMGRDLAAPASWDARLENAGFERVQHENLDWPIGVPRGETDDRIVKIGGMVGENYQIGIRGISVGFFTRGAGWTEEQVDEYLVPVKRDLKDNPGESVIPIHVVYGQKPE